MPLCPMHLKQCGDISMEQNVATTQPLGVSHRFSHDNLHISLDTQFNTPQANALMELLHCNHESCKRIFIDVRRVSNPHPSAVDALKTSLLLGGFGTEQVVFKGKTGFDMAVSGNRVLIEQKKEHVCKGNCANCKCGHHKHAEN